MALPEIINPDFPQVREGAASPIYQTRLVAYIDVLGWSDLLRRSVRDPSLLEIIGIAAMALAFPTIASTHRRNFEKEHGVKFPEAIEVTHFSDTIVFSCPPTSSAGWSLIGDVQRTCVHLLQMGHYTRGAIVLGKVHHDDHSIFGPALVEAHYLEQNVAKYPRIIVTAVATPLVDGRFLIPPDEFATKWHLRRDTDGLTYVDVLGGGPGWKGGSRSSFLGLEAKLLEEANRRLDADADDLGRVASILG